MIIFNAVPIVICQMLVQILAVPLKQELSSVGIGSIAHNTSIYELKLIYNELGRVNGTKRDRNCHKKVQSDEANVRYLR